MFSRLIRHYIDFFTNTPPTFWLIVGIASAGIFLLMTRPFLSREFIKAHRTPIIFFSLACISAYFANIAYYTRSVVLGDHLAPTFIITSTLWGRGQPIYTALDGANRYAMLYGPDPYIIVSAFQKMFGSTISVSKIPGSACAIGMILVLLWTLKRETSWTLSLVASAYAVLTLAQFAESSFCVRVDPFLNAFVCLGLAASRLRNSTAAAILCGIAMGCAADVKIHAVLCFLPLLALILRDRGWKPALAAIIIGVAVTLLPFLIFPSTISITLFAQWLHLAGKHKLFIISMSSLLEWTLMVVFPTLIAAASFALADFSAFKQWCSNYKFVLTGLFFGLALTLIAASKEGAGPHHLMPFAVLFAYVFCRLIADHPASLPAGRSAKFIEILTVGYLFAALLISFTNQAKIVRFILGNRAGANAAIADIRTAESQYAGSTIGVGYSDRDYFSTYFRVILVYDGQPCLLDAAAIMDMEESDLHIPPATFDAIKNGDTRVWLMPANEGAFTLPNWYDSHPIIFSPEFRQLFFEHYTKHPLGKVFDAWVYHP